MTFDNALKKLHTKLRTGGDVRMTQGQFAKMLEQFYKLGYSEGVKDRDEARKEAAKEFDKVFKEVDEAFDQAFRWRRKRPFSFFDRLFSKRSKS